MYILFSNQNQFVCNHNNLEEIIDAVKNIDQCLTIKLAFASETTTTLDELHNNIDSPIKS